MASLVEHAANMSEREKAWFAEIDDAVSAAAAELDKERANRNVDRTELNATAKPAAGAAAENPA